MKKSLVALAALAATSVFAQSSVTIYGVIDQAYTTRKSDQTVGGTSANYAITGIGDDQASTHGEGGLAGSRLGFSGTEDLGAGQKASFVVEFALFPSEKANYTNGTSMRLRQSYVSYASADAGEVQLGRVYTPLWRTYNGEYDPGLGNNVVGYVFNQNGSGSRQANAIQYISPAFNGAKAYVMKGFGQTKTKEGVANTAAGGEKLDEVTSYALEYRNGPVSANYGYEKTKNHTLHDLTWNNVNQDALADSMQLVGRGAAGTMGQSSTVGSPDTVATGLAAAYNFGVAKVAYMNNKMTLKGETGWNGGADLSVKANGLTVSVPVGAATLWALSSKAENDASSAVTAKATQFGARYALSKRTDVYLITGKADITKAGSADFVNFKQDAIGIRHQF